MSPTAPAVDVAAGGGAADAAAGAGEPWWPDRPSMAASTTSTPAQVPIQERRDPDPQPAAAQADKRAVPPAPQQQARLDPPGGPQHAPGQRPEHAHQELEYDQLGDDPQDGGQSPQPACPV